MVSLYQLPFFLCSYLDCQENVAFLDDALTPKALQALTDHFLEAGVFLGGSCVPWHIEIFFKWDTCQAN